MDFTAHLVYVRRIEAIHIPLAINPTAQVWSPDVASGGRAKLAASGSERWKMRSSRVARSRSRLVFDGHGGEVFRCDLAEL